MNVGNWINQYEEIRSLSEKVAAGSGVSGEAAYTAEGAEKITQWYKDCKLLFQKALESENPDQCPGYAIILIMHVLKYGKI